MSVATCQDFRTLDEDIFKSYLYKDQEIKRMVNPELCCLDLLNIELDVFLGCKNQQCNKTLNLLPGAKIVNVIIVAVSCMKINVALYFIARCLLKIKSLHY